MVLLTYPPSFSFSQTVFILYQNSKLLTDGRSICQLPHRLHPSFPDCSSWLRGSGPRRSQFSPILHRRPFNDTDRPPQDYPPPHSHSPPRFSPSQHLPANDFSEGKALPDVHRTLSSLSLIFLRVHRRELLRAPILLF